MRACGSREGAGRRTGTLRVEAEPSGGETNASFELVFRVSAAGPVPCLITPISVIPGSLKSGQGVGKGEGSY